MIRRAMLIAVALCCLSQGTAAEKRWGVYNGNLLHKACEAKSPLCDGYMLGIVDALFNERVFCPAQDVAQTSARAISVTIPEIDIMPLRA